jgi:hypothetical protein
MCNDAIVASFQRGLASQPLLRGTEKNYGDPEWGLPIPGPTFGSGATQARRRSAAPYVAMFCYSLSEYSVLSTQVLCYLCRHGMARPQFANGGDGLCTWRAAATVLYKESLAANIALSLSLGSWMKNWKIPTLKINLGLGNVLRNDSCSGYICEVSTLELFGLGYGHLVGCCEKGNKLWGSIKYGEFLD